MLGQKGYLLKLITNGLKSSPEMCPMLNQFKDHSSINRYIRFNQITIRTKQVLISAPFEDDTNVKLKPRRGAYFAFSPATFLVRMSSLKAPLQLIKFKPSRVVLCSLSRRSLPSQIKRVVVGGVTLIYRAFIHC